MQDELKIRRALELAERGWGRTSPNPMVGCVIASPDGLTLAEGWHDGPGTAHAEVLALRMAAEASVGATLYCTLEPCDHQGRTGPCTEAIVDAGIARVVLGAVDPNPIVDGQGIARLRAAGIQVDTGVLPDECGRLNEAYAHHVTTGLPWVTLKVAASLDGKTAARDGSSQWITGEEARLAAHRLRAGADAILVGAGTVVADDPQLTVRHPEFPTARPLRVVADSSGRTDPGRAVFDDHAPTMVMTTDAAPSAVRAAWTAAGAEVVVLDATADGRLSLPQLVKTLGKRDVTSVLLEGGRTLAGAAVAADIVDKVVCYLAPAFIGGDAAPGILGDPGIATLADAVALTFAGSRQVGADIELEAYVHRDH